MFWFKLDNEIIVSRFKVNQDRRRYSHVKVDAVLERHNWDVKLWLWAIKEIHFFLFLDNAWLSISEQETFTIRLLKDMPHKSDLADLLSKVKCVL